MPDLTREQFRAAETRAQARLKGPRAVSAHYDCGRNRVIVALTSGVEIGFAPENAQGLEQARAADLDIIEITPAGLGLHFPRIDADIYVPALLEGVLGSANWIARLMGEKGGKARSSAKAAAARHNGHKGGRPRKVAAV